MESSAMNKCLGLLIDFFSNLNLVVQNKVIKIAAPVLEGLEYQMALLFQSMMGRGRSHPVCSGAYCRKPQPWAGYGRTLSR